jgi:hypothetical protein
MAENKKAKRRREQRKNQLSLRSYWSRASQDRSAPLFNLLQIPTTSSFMASKFNRAKFTFFGAEWPYYARSAPEYEGALERCREWFAFDYQVDDRGNTPARSFVDGNYTSWDADERRAYFQYLNNIYSAFKVTVVEKENGFTVQDLADEKAYRIKDEKNIYHMAKGDVLIGRIFPAGDSYVLSNTGVRLTKEFSGAFERRRKEIMEEIGPLYIEELFKREESEPKDIQSLEKRLSPFLKVLTDGKLTMKDLTKIVDESSHPSQVLDRLKKEIDFESEDEEKAFSKLIDSLWNYTPRTEFGGASPDEMQLKRVGQMGPQEYSLIHEMERFVASRFRLALYPNLQTVNEAMRRLQDEWLKTPQEELDGKTPREVIMSERRLLGNDSEEISYAELTRPSDSRTSDDHPLLIRP